MKPIVVTRYGVMKEYGATAPSITFVGSDGRKAIGSVDMFFLSETEARVEANNYINGNLDCFSPSTDWEQGGPIIEREKISVWPDEASTEWLAEYRFKLQRDDEYWGGPTPLIAAMRCYCCSKLGDVVDIPGELCQQQSS